MFSLGQLVIPRWEKFRDLTWIEITNYILLAAGVFWVGLYPEALIKVLQVTLEHLLSQSMPYGMALGMPSREFYFYG